VPRAKGPPDKVVKPGIIRWPDRSSKPKKVVIEEEDNEDMHRPGMGFPLPFPVLLEEEENIALDNIERMVNAAPNIFKSRRTAEQVRKELEELDEIVQEFSRAYILKGQVQGQETTATPGRETLP
jgi:hypothetical protein